jgi:small GTP-binding protein
VQEIGEDLIAVLVVDREGLLIEALTQDENQDSEKKFIGAFSALVELVLKRITKEFKLGTFGAGTFDTDKYRFIFCEAGPEFVFVSVFHSLAMIDPYFSYAYLAAEKIARIFDGRPVSPVIPQIAIDSNVQRIERKISTIQKIKIHSSDYIYKLILGGDGNVGKTSMVQRFVHDRFQTDYKATIGTSITKKECAFEDLESSVRFVIWDLAGQPQFARIRSNYLANSSAGILVFDVTDENSFKSIRTWYNEIQKYAPPEIFLILVGNKIDLEEKRTVSTEQGKELANELGISYIETSAKTGENINDAFKMLALQLVHKFVEAEEVYKLITETFDKDSAQLVEHQRPTKLPDMSKYHNVPIQTIWEDLNRDFIPWLKNNLDVLEDILNLPLKSTESPTQASLHDTDILAIDNNDNKVIIETQFKKTIDEKLGKILTGLTKHDAKIAIWITEKIRPKHKEALNWLNQHTSEEFFFFLVKFEVLQFKDYQPIPKFTKILGPSLHKWDETPRKRLNYLESERVKFWKGLIEKVNESMLDQEDLDVSTKNWIGSETSVEGINLNYVIKKNWSAVELFFNHEDPEVNKERFKKFQSKKYEIEEKFGEISWHLSEDLDWNYEENRSYQSIRYRFKNGGLVDKKLWDQIQYSMIDAMKCLQTSVSPYIRALII